MHLFFFAHGFLYSLNTRHCLCNVSTAVFQKNVFVSSNRCFLHLQTVGKTGQPLLEAASSPHQVGLPVEIL